MTDEELEMMAEEAKKMASYLTSEDSAESVETSEADTLLPMYKDKCFILQQENKILRKALEIITQHLYILAPFKTAEEFNEAVHRTIKETIELAKQELEKEQKDENRN